MKGVLLARDQAVSAMLGTSSQEVEVYVLTGLVQPSAEVPTVQRPSVSTSDLLARQRSLLSVI